MTAKTPLCNKCEGYVIGLLNELLVEAEAFKRGQLIKDCIYDLWCCLEEGSIQPVRQRDRARKQGKKTERRLKPKQDFVE